MEELFDTKSFPEAQIYLKRQEEMIKNDSNSGYLFQLLRAVLKNEQPPELPENGSFEAVFALADHHSVANLAYYGIEKLSKKPEAELLKKWAKVRDREIMRDIVQSAELEQITTAFTDAGIRFLTMKGTILKAMYPQSDFRTMGDIDLLIDEENLGKAGALLISMGYEAEELDHLNHDVYYKRPVMNIELHYELFSHTRECYAKIFDDIWNKAEIVAGTRYRLQSDYCFAYVMAHAMGHYKWGGTGLRSFMDFYIYRHKAGDRLHMDMIRGLFADIGEAELFDDFISLSDIWFGSGTITDKHCNMAEYILRGGTYGTFENQVTIGMKGKNKGKYLLERFFPSLSYMQDQFPVLKKAPVLLPVFWIVRMFKGATVNRKQNIAKFKALNKK